MVGGHGVAFWEVLGCAVLWEVLSCVGLLLVLGYVVCMVGKGARGGYFEVKAIFKSYFFCKVSSKILGKLFSSSLGACVKSIIWPTNCQGNLSSQLSDPKCSSS